MREDWFHLFCNPHPVIFAGKLGSSCSILDISQDRARGAPAAFKNNEPRVVEICATEMKFLEFRQGTAQTAGGWCSSSTPLTDAAVSPQMVVIPKDVAQGSS